MWIVSLYILLGITGYLMGELGVPDNKKFKRSLTCILLGSIIWLAWSGGRRYGQDQGYHEGRRDGVKAASGRARMSSDIIREVEYCVMAALPRGYVVLQRGMGLPTFYKIDTQSDVSFTPGWCYDVKENGAFVKNGKFVLVSQ